MEKKKIENLSILRGFAAFVIVIYHIKRGTGCSYGPLNWMFSNAAIWMTVFFALSGFVLYYNYSEYVFDNYNEIATFLKKRISSIYPMYAVIWVVYFFYYFRSSNVQNDILTFPIQLCLLQCIQYYDYFINQGIWFFSCIFICYIVFPYICCIVREARINTILFFLFVIYIIDGSLPFAYNVCEISAYFSAFCRVMEFSAGVCTAKIFLEHRINISAANLLALSLFSGICLFLVQKTDFLLIATYQERINILSIPLACVLIYAFASCRSPNIHKIAELKIIKFFSKHSLGCYGGYLFAYLAYKDCLWQYFVFFGNRNLYAIFSVFALNIFFAIILDKISNILKALFIKNGPIKCVAVFALIMCILIGIKFVTYSL